jgi:hypothetical protein
MLNRKNDKKNIRNCFKVPEGMEGKLRKLGGKRTEEIERNSRAGQTLCMFS